MFDERVEKIRNIVRSAKADAFLLLNHELSGQPGTRYLSGFSGSESILVITESEKFILADGRYFLQAQEECPDFQLVKVERFSHLEALAKVCRASSLKTVVIDGARTSYHSVSKLSEVIHDVVIISKNDVLQEIRAVKDDAEIMELQRAARIACGAFERFLPYLREGLTEKELAVKLEFLMKEGGAEQVAFEVIVASGANGAKPHGKPTEKKIKRGELITFDFGCFSNGYASDMTRTVALGNVSPALAKIYEVTKTAQELGCKAAKAGITGKELDAVCRDYIATKGYGEYFLHSAGHGLGMEVHELPYVSSKNEKPLPENAVVTIEPGIYIEGLGGVRIEDSLVLKRNGNINLSEKISKELITI
ncbi:MAG: aminopeptidase P family protein [Candidatus Liptonbacteria bacterium]|nr:aminopeptidase P family protein [Candidatus Liptonbacteria bacterium]